MDKAAAQPEFSRLISAERIGIQETMREIAANAAERQRLAERLGLLSLDRLAATLRLQRLRGDVVRLRGRLEADVVQACVVSLEPVPARLVEDFSASYAASVEAGGGEIVLAVEDEDPPEAMQNGRIDLGETVVQQLAVALDPYPRSAAAAIASVPADEPAASGRRPTAFAALDELRRRRDE